jgi:23S rRNA U2552 (ribose-2'-O)-methylase RlmE/FtsJ
VGELDLTPVELIAGAAVLAKDFYDDDTPDVLKALLGGPADVVLSDLAAPATGDPKIDHLPIRPLADAGHEFALPGNQIEPDCQSSQRSEHCYKKKQPTLVTSYAL